MSLQSQKMAKTSFKNILLFVGLLSLNAKASDMIDPALIKKNANAIDVIVAENFKLNNITVPKVTDDATFMRRAFLVSIGRMPTPKEALQFIELEHPDKRSLLIDYLYNSKGYSSHLTNWYYDLFTLRESFGSNTVIRDNGRLIDWFRDAAASNMAWDDLCREILTSRGNVYETSKPAGYFEKGDAVDDHLSNTVRIFTGVRLECAQCHDDPFQEWEQMDFYTLKAFVEGPVGYKGKGDYGGIFSKVRELQTSSPGKYSNNHVGRLQSLLFSLNAVASHGTSPDKGYGRVELPENYQYRDGKPGEMVGGRTPFGDKLRTGDSRNDKDSLTKFADWMTSDKTPEFSITIANRLWERVMGISLTPVTGDYVDPKDTNFRKLILKLATIMKDYDYDMKTYQKTLMSTRTFQFVSTQKDLKNGEKNALDGRRATRMSAEQIWDSLLSLSVADPDSLPTRAKESSDFLYAGQLVMSKADMAKKVNSLNTEEFNDYLFELYEQLKKKEFPAAEAGADSSDVYSNMRSYRRGVNSGQLKRASEFPSPAGGFFAVFGQSTREAAIDEASKEGTVSQALELLNGQVQSLIIHNPKSSANQVIDQIEGEEERIKTIFLVVLNRIPDDNEMKLCLDVVKGAGNKAAAYRNIVAGLISSQEFYFIF